MSNTKHVWISECECGCGAVPAVCSDLAETPQMKKEVARFVADHIKRGLPIRKVTSGEFDEKYRQKIGRCEAKKGGPQ